LFHQIPEPGLYTENYPLHVTRKGSMTVQKIYDSFFEDSTGVLSGKDGQTKTLDKKIHEWEAEWNAAYPRFLREQVRTFLFMHFYRSITKTRLVVFVFRWPKTPCCSKSRSNNTMLLKWGDRGSLPF
jgi:hypothetical protein